MRCGRALPQFASRLPWPARRVSRGMPNWPQPWTSTARSSTCSRTLCRSPARLPPRAEVPTPAPLHLAVALDGAGWHPAAWREPDAQPERLFTAGYWTELARHAERGLLDFLTIEDGLDLQSDDRFQADSRTDRVRGRLDAVLIAARVAPVTRHIGFVPTAITTHTEPFHLSKAIATLDYVSAGRAGIRVQVAARAGTTAHFGRREILPLEPDRLGDPDTRRLIADHFDEAADYVEVLRRLWDSWEDDAEIRDVAFVTPRDAAHAAEIVAEIRTEQARAGRAGMTVHVFGDLVVFLDETKAAAVARRQRLDERAGTEYHSDAHIFTGTAVGLADLLQEWQAAGLSGFRLRPAALPHDLTQLTERLVPELRRRCLFRARYEADTLRGLLGLGRPANRYAAA